MLFAIANKTWTTFYICFGKKQGLKWMILKKKNFGCITDEYFFLIRFQKLHKIVFAYSFISRHSKASLLFLKKTKLHFLVDGWSPLPSLRTRPLIKQVYFDVIPNSCPTQKKSFFAKTINVQLMHSKSSCWINLSWKWWMMKYINWFST